MNFKNFEGYKYIDGGVCAAKGFKANGLNCGLNKDKNKFDLGLVYSEVMCNTAAVYTVNKVKAAPILVTQANLNKSDGKAKAIIANSKNANACNKDGEEKALKMCKSVAEKLNINPEEVIVASTGVIGQPLQIEFIESSMNELVLGLDENGNQKAANAIMTTDTFLKDNAEDFKINNKICHLGGMAKGSGMIHPNMATTLNFITTDVAISSELLNKALKEIVNITYNCLSVDGDTSTNDMVCVLASGMAQNTEIKEENEDYEIFKKSLYIVMMNMTRMLAKDGEGATKLLECTCSGAASLDVAIKVAKSVIGSSLFKCAMFGEDANWGRILCAIGYADAEFDINKVDVSLSSSHGKIEVCKDGYGVPFSEEYAKEVLSKDEIFINIDLKSGDYEASSWGCDLTYDYVKINGDYRS